MSTTKKNQIVKELIKAYWAEIETISNYIANSVNLDGVRAEEIKKSLAMEINDELLHAQTLAKRIKELGGKVPGSYNLKPVQKFLQPPDDNTNVVHVIKGVIAAEDMAISQYNNIIKLTDGFDYVTQDICVRLLADEESHRSIYSGYLKEYTK